MKKVEFASYFLQLSPKLNETIPGIITNFDQKNLKLAKVKNKTIQYFEN